MNRFFRLLAVCSLLSLGACAVENEDDNASDDSSELQTYVNPSVGHTETPRPVPWRQPSLVIVRTQVNAPANTAPKNPGQGSEDTDGK